MVEHLTGVGAVIFEHACKLGLEGIVPSVPICRISRAAPGAGSRSRTGRIPQ